MVKTSLRFKPLIMKRFYSSNSKQKCYYLHLELHFNKVGVPIIYRGQFPSRRINHFWTSLLEKKIHICAYGSILLLWRWQPHSFMKSSLSRGKCEPNMTQNVKVKSHVCFLLCSLRWEEKKKRHYCFKECSLKKSYCSKFQLAQVWKRESSNFTSIKALSHCCLFSSATCLRKAATTLFMTSETGATKTGYTHQVI
jgi:hypothetical protein